MSYLSKKGYVLKKENFTIDELLKLKKELRARPLASDNIYNVYIETKNKIYIPKMYGLEKFGIPDTILNNYNGEKWSHDIEFKGNLFENQKIPVNLLYESCINKGGGILSLSVGGGKTFCALNVISKLKYKTIIIVNKITLLNQWIQEINTFLPDANVGIIQGQKNIDITDKDIVVAMLQSLSRIDYPDSLFESFGVTITDEAHNFSSKCFSQIFFKLTSIYSIGLTATPNRADGCEHVFKWHIGDVVFSNLLEPKGLTPIVHCLKIESKDYKEITTINKFTGQTQIQFTSMLSDLIDMPKRNNLIIELIKHSLKEQRKILVISDRRNHLVELNKLLDNDPKVTFTYGLFLGAMKETDLNNSKACTVILATAAAFGEGISEKNLNTIIICTPKKYIGHLKNTVKNESGKLEQLIGRILRMPHIHIPPLIIDLQDHYSVYKNQSNGRKKFYKKHNFELQNLSINLDEHQIINYNSIKINKPKQNKEEQYNSINKFIMLEDI